MISNLAYVHPDAKLGENVTVEPFAYIEADVVIGEGSWIGPHASVMAGTRMGKNCKVTGTVIHENVEIKDICTLLKNLT